MHGGVPPCRPCGAAPWALSLLQHLSIPGSRLAPVPEPALGTATLPEERLCRLLPVCCRDGTPHAAPGHMASSRQPCLGRRNRRPKSTRPGKRQQLALPPLPSRVLKRGRESVGSLLLPLPGFYCSTAGKSSPGLAPLSPTRSAADPPFTHSSVPQPRGWPAWGRLLSSLFRLGVFCPK